MRLSLSLLIGVQYMIVSVSASASSASPQKNCVTHCGPNKCKSDQFCRVKYRQLCSDEPEEPIYECVTANYATYNVKFSRTKVETDPELHSFFYRTDIFSNCKKGHNRNLTWAWPAQLIKHFWIVEYLDPFLRHYEGSKNEMYKWKRCQCGMHACPESFKLSANKNGTPVHVDDQFSYEFSCHKWCDPLKTRAVEANFTKTKNGTQDFEGHAFLPPMKLFCTKNAFPSPTPRIKPPEAQVYQTCPGIKRTSNVTPGQTSRTTPHETQVVSGIKTTSNASPAPTARNTSPETQVVSSSIKTAPSLLAGLLLAVVVALFFD